MSAARIGHILAAAAAAGFRVGVVDGRTRVRREALSAPASPPAHSDESWRASLRAVDPALLSRVLSVDLNAWQHSLGADERDAFAERAAILEFEAGIARDVAERVALCWCEGDR